VGQGIVQIHSEVLIAMVAIDTGACYQMRVQVTRVMAAAIATTLARVAVIGKCGDHESRLVGTEPPGALRLEVVSAAREFR